MGRSLSPPPPTFHPSSSRLAIRTSLSFFFSPPLRNKERKKIGSANNPKIKTRKKISSPKTETKQTKVKQTSYKTLILYPCYIYIRQQPRIIHLCMIMPEVTHKSNNMKKMKTKHTINM